LPRGGGRGAASLAALQHLPTVARDQLAQAAVTGFHDTLWLLVVVSALGLAAALLLHDHALPRAAGRTAPMDYVE
jgi:hypothetical protein